MTDLSDKEQLFNTYLPKAKALVNTYCCKYHALYPIKEDLMSEASCGLWEACLRLDDKHNSAPWSFMYWRVKGSIVDYARQQKIWIRDRELKAGRKNYKVESLREAHHGNNGDPSTIRNDGVYEAFGVKFTLEDKKHDIEINKIEVGMIIDSGTNGMSPGKKDILKRFFCEGVSVSDMSGDVAKWYAWATIREGLEEMRNKKVFINTSRRSR